MPIYEFRCQACGEVSEIFQGVGDKDGPLQCKYCGSKELERVLSPRFFSFKVAASEGGEIQAMPRGDGTGPPGAGRGVGRGMGMGMGRG